MNPKGHPILGSPLVTHSNSKQQLISASVSSKGLDDIAKQEKDAKEAKDPKAKPNIATHNNSQSSTIADRARGPVSKHIYHNLRDIDKLTVNDKFMVKRLNQ